MPGPIFKVEEVDGSIDDDGRAIVSEAGGEGEVPDEAGTTILITCVARTATITNYWRFYLHSREDLVLIL